MRKLAEACEQIAGTSKKLEKIAIVAEYFQSTPSDQAAIAAVFLSGRPFPVWEETTLQVGGTLLWRVIRELSGKTEAGSDCGSYRRLGDLGAVAGEVLPEPSADSELSPSEVQAQFRQIAAARGPAAKGVLVRQLLSQVTPLEAKYVVKIMTGDLRIGLKESLVEEAIAKALRQCSPRSAARQPACWAISARRYVWLPAEDWTTLACGCSIPLGFMLASPAESAEDVLSYFENAWVEDKYDGIRAQAHCSGGEVRFFSRTRDEITESFPELPEALSGLRERRDSRRRDRSLELPDGRIG